MKDALPAALPCLPLVGNLAEFARDQLSSLGLVLNAVALWNTLYLDRAISHLRESGTEVRDEDLARVSPLMHAHVRLLGRYHVRPELGRPPDVPRP